MDEGWFIKENKIVKRHNWNDCVKPSALNLLIATSN
jgi:hypothetical protein